MKSYISKIFIGAALFSMTGLVSCVGDLDQLPNDPNSITSGNFGEDPQKYLSEVMAKCYSSLAVSGQGSAMEVRIFPVLTEVLPTGAVLSLCLMSSQPMRLHGYGRMSECSIFAQAHGVLPMACFRVLTDVFILTLPYVTTS